MRLLAALLAGALAVPASGTPASARTPTTPAILSAILTTAAPVLPLNSGCANRAYLVAVVDDPDRLVSVVRTRSRIGAAFAAGNTWYAQLTARRSGRTLTLTSPALLCGYGGASVRPYGSDPAGRYTWLLSVAHGRSAATTATRAFQLRHRGEMTLDAGPEPVPAGGVALLRATVSDGWEEFADTRVGFWFRPYGTPRYRFRGSVPTRCVEYCDSSFAVRQARARLRQPRAGIWKAISWPTARVSATTAFDVVPAP